MPAFIIGAIGAFFSNAKGLFKLLLFASFVAMLIAFGVWFVSFSNDVYALIISATSDLSSSYGGLLGCILNKLGLVEFMNSVFAIVFSAFIFWATAVGYIVTYKLGLRAYNGIFKALT